jgi:hypothetical protein
VDTHISGCPGKRRRNRPAICVGRVAPPQIVLHDLAQRQVGGELGRLGAAGALVGQRVCHRRPVATVAVGVATQLA